MGAHLLSWDFGAGILAGAAAGTLFSLSVGVRAQAFTFFLTLGGIGAGVTALVLAPLAMMLSMLSPGFIEFLGKTQSGLRGLILPFRSVVAVSGTASVTAIVLSLLAAADTPLLQPWVYFVAAFVPVGLFAWGVAGCIQVIGITVDIIQQDRAYRDLDARRTAAQGRAS